MGLSLDQRKKIILILEDRDRMTREELIDFIRPHYTPDTSILIKRDLGRIANEIASRVCDTKGDRCVFAIKDEDCRKIINIEKNNNIEDIEKVQMHLIKARDCRDYHILKTKEKYAELAGQTALEFSEV